MRRLLSALAVVAFLLPQVGAQAAPPEAPPDKATEAAPSAPPPAETAAQIPAAAPDKTPSTDQAAATAKTAPAKTPDIVPEAKQAVAALCAYLKSQPVVALHAEETVEKTYPGGKTIQLAREVDVALKRPDKLFIRIFGDDRDRVIVYDGKTLAMADLDKGVYATVDAPPTVEALLDNLAAKYGLSLPLADFLGSEACAKLLDHVQVGDDLGTHLAAGLPCRHLAFTQPDVDWQLWIEQGTAPLPRKLVITDKQKMGWPQYAVTFTGFDFQPSLPEKLFTFTPEKNARKIEFLPLARPQGQAK